MVQKNLVVIGMQREYITRSRPFYIDSIEESLEKARMMLSYARKQGWNIIHVRHIKDGPLFERDSEYADFIDGFTPVIGEFEVVKYKYSCLEFCEIAHDFFEDEFMIIGYATNACCLATIIDAYHRGYKFAILRDATHALKVHGFSEDAMHEHAIAISERFARVSELCLEVSE